MRDETGLVVDYITEGDFPMYGNDDDRADELAALVVKTVMDKIRHLPMYRDAVPTQSVLTITSNVVYGKATGAFPSGHKAGTPFAPGANPENGMDTHGMVASMLSVGKLDYDDALDGIVHALSTRYSMKHVTLQVDLGTTEHRCALDAPAHRH